MSTPTRRGVRVLTVVYLVAVEVVTLSPQPSSTPGGPLLRLSQWLAGSPLTRWLTFDHLEFTANVIMFVPFGVLVTLLLGRDRWWWVLLLAAGTTVLIESAQLVIPNRVSDVRDLIANTTGAGLGLAVTLIAISRLGPEPVDPMTGGLFAALCSMV